MDQKQIGLFIAQCRKSKNMTQSQLAERLNITNKSVSKWENGRCLPDPSLYESLCNILGITINELFAGRNIRNEEYKRIADENLMQLLTHKVYPFGDKSIALSEIDHALNKMAETAARLQQFDSKEEAVDYLMRKTNLPIEECSNAYDFYARWFTTDSE